MKAYTATAKPSVIRNAQRKLSGAIALPNIIHTLFTLPTMNMCSSQPPRRPNNAPTTVRMELSR